jgi:hypothetical protein
MAYYRDEISDIPDFYNVFNGPKGYSHAERIFDVGKPITVFPFLAANAFNPFFFACLSRNLSYALHSFMLTFAGKPRAIEKHHHLPFLQTM